MKTQIVKIACTLSMLLFFVSVSSGQSCRVPSSTADFKELRDLAGTWEGEVIQDGKPKPFSISFAKEGDVIVATVFEGTLRHAAEVSRCSKNKFHVYGSLLSGEAFCYNANLKDGRLSGNLQLGNTCSVDQRSAFILHRKNE